MVFDCSQEHACIRHRHTASGNQGIFNREWRLEAHTLVIKGKLLIGLESFVCGPLVDASRTQQVTELLSAKVAEHKRSVRWNLPGFKVYFWPLSETLQTPDPARKQILVIYALKVSKETPAETDSSACVWLS